VLDGRSDARRSRARRASRHRFGCHRLTVASACLHYSIDAGRECRIARGAASGRARAPHSETAARAPCSASVRSAQDGRDAPRSDLRHWTPHALRRFRRSAALARSARGWFQDHRASRPGPRCFPHRIVVTHRPATHKQAHRRRHNGASVSCQAHNARTRPPLRAFIAAPCEGVGRIRYRRQAQGNRQTHGTTGRLAEPLMTLFPEHALVSARRPPTADRRRVPRRAPYPDADSHASRFRFARRAGIVAGVPRAGVRLEQGRLLETRTC
jgi:hypothetical protein